MAGGYYPVDLLKDSSAVVVGNSETKTQIGKDFTIYAGGSKHMRIDITCSSTTATATVNFEHASTRKGTYAIAKTVVAADGVVSILIAVANDTSICPLKCQGKISVTTNGSGEVTVSKIEVMQEV